MKPSELCSHKGLVVLKCRASPKPSKWCLVPVKYNPNLPSISNFVLRVLFSFDLSLWLDSDVDVFSFLQTFLVFFFFPNPVWVFSWIKIFFFSHTFLISDHGYPGTPLLGLPQEWCQYMMIPWSLKTGQVNEEPFPVIRNTVFFISFSDTILSPSFTSFSAFPKAQSMPFDSIIFSSPLERKSYPFQGLQWALMLRTSK